MSGDILTGRRQAMIQRGIRKVKGLAVRVLRTELQWLRGLMQSQNTSSTLESWSSQCPEKTDQALLQQAFLPGTDQALHPKFREATKALQPLPRERRSTTPRAWQMLSRHLAEIRIKDLGLIELIGLNYSAYLWLIGFILGFPTALLALRNESLRRVSTSLTSKFSCNQLPHLHCVNSGAVNEPDRRFQTNPIPVLMCSFVFLVWWSFRPETQKTVILTGILSKRKVSHLIAIRPLGDNARNTSSTLRREQSSHTCRRPSLQSQCILHIFQLVFMQICACMYVSNYVCMSVCMYVRTLLLNQAFGWSYNGDCQKPSWKPPSNHWHPSVKHLSITKHPFEIIPTCLNQICITGFRSKSIGNSRSKKHQGATARARARATATVETKPPLILKRLFEFPWRGGGVSPPH